MNENQIPEDILRRLRELAHEPAPVPTGAMSAFLADPSSSLIEKGDLAAMAGSNVHGSADAQMAGLPKEKSVMKAKLAALRGQFINLGTIARLAVVTAVIAAAGMGTAAAATAVSFVVEDSPPASVDTQSDVEGSTDPELEDPSGPGNQSDSQGDDEGTQGATGGQAGDQTDDQSGDQGTVEQGDDNQVGDQGDDNQVGDESDDQGDNEQADDQGDGDESDGDQGSSDGDSSGGGSDNSGGGSDSSGGGSDSSGGSED